MFCHGFSNFFSKFHVRCQMFYSAELQKEYNYIFHLFQLQTIIHENMLFKKVPVAPVLLLQISFFLILNA